MPFVTPPGLLDLDELPHACLSLRAADHMAEAVACYRAGAYRQATVATWIAVVYDYIDKLRDLVLTGHADARAELDKFEDAHRTHNVSKALALERALLDVARRDFELLTEPEKRDLERLHEDRHRCAHPSLDGDEEPFVATAELARLHMRNAVDHMLSRPPVQGRAALERVFRDIDSDYFPTEVEAARERLEGGPLGAARASLARSVIVRLLGEVLQEEGEAADRERRFAALGAMFELDRGFAEEVLGQSLPRVIDHIPHDEWGRVFSLIESLPVAWEHLSDGDVQVTRQYVEGYDFATSWSWRKPPLIESALSLPGLEDAALDALGRVLPIQLQKLIEEDPRVVYINETVRRLEVSGSYTETSSLRGLLLVAAPYFGADEVERTLKAYEDNRQFRNYVSSEKMLVSVLNATEVIADATRPAWERLIPHLADPEEVSAALRKRYPGIMPEPEEREEAPAVATDEATA